MDDLNLILVAIQNQRWYFFENNDKIIFDRFSGLIWINLNQIFPYKNYRANNSYKEVHDLVKNTNEKNWGGYNNWRVPEKNEIMDMIDDKTFPLHTGSNWRINNLNCWCIEYPNYGFSYRDLDFEDHNNPTDYVNVILCSDALKPAENFSSKPQAILNIFKINKLIPKFDIPEANIIYKKLFADEPQQPAKVETSKINLPAKFDYKPLLAKYDTAAINQSPVKFYKAVISVADEILNDVQKILAAHSKTFEEFSQLSLKINAPYSYGLWLEYKEKSLLENRRRTLAKLFEFGFDEVIENILALKDEAGKLSAECKNFMYAENILAELARIESKPHVSFEFLMESIAESVTVAQDKINFFNENKKFVAAIIDAQEVWSTDYISSINSGKINYTDWRKLRFAIESNFLPPVEFALKENALSTETLLQVLEILREYKFAVDDFYIDKNAKLSRDFEDESELYKLAETFQSKMQKIIFACEKASARVFLQKWADNLTDISIYKFEDYYRDTDEIKTKILELQCQNFITYLADYDLYSAEMEKRRQNFFAVVSFRQNN
ncbi:MAG: DUF1566 domain-containing protein [Selenomonadaceae bacterium]|nr:DUF1566 domain-containing protein [Selenomonadaceae bacterium]